MNKLPLSSVPGGYAAKNRLNLDFLKQYGLDDSQTQEPLAPSLRGQADELMAPSAPPTPGQPLSPPQMMGSLENLKQVPGQLENLAQQRGALAIRGAEEQRPGLENIANIYSKEAQATEQDRFRQEDFAKRAQQATQAKMAEYEKAVEEHTNATVDPHRMMEGGRGVVAAIGMALGAFGAALAHTPNFAADIVNKAIDRDIAAQEAEIAKKGKTVELKNNLVDMNRRLFQDEGLALEAARGTRQRQVASLIDAQAAQMAPGEKKNEAQRLALQMKEEAAKTTANIYEGAAKLEHGQALLQFESEQNRQKQGQDQGVVVQGLKIIPGARPTTDDIKEAKDIKASRDNLSGILQQLKNLRQEAGTEVLPWTDAAKMGSTLVSQAKLMIKELNKLGAWDLGAEKIANEILGGDPTGFINPTTRYDQVINEANRTSANKLRVHNFYDPMISGSVSKDQLESMGP